MSSNTDTPPDAGTKQPGARNKWLGVKKIIHSIILLFTALLCILFGLIFFFSATDRGLKLLLTSLQEATTERFQFATVQGNLLTRFTLTGLQYQDSHIKLAVREFYFHWQSKDLLNKTINIEQITAAGIRFTQLSPEKEKTPESATTQAIIESLPPINLPLDIKLKQLQLSDIQLIRLADTREQLPAEHIDQLSLSATLYKSQLTLQQLSLTAQQYNGLTINLNGSAELKENYPLSLQSEIKLNLEELSAATEQTLSLTGSIQGNLAQIKIKQDISGLFDATLDFQAEDLLKAIHWSGKIQLSRLPVKLLTAENHPGLQGQSLSAEIHSSGDLSQAQTSISSTLPDNNGSLELNSNIIWHKGIHWRVKLLTEKINPGLLHQEWPGSLNIELFSDGEYAPGQLIAQIQLQQLNGQLRQQPVKGTGQFQLKNNSLDIQHLNLSSGSAQLKADGRLDNAGKNSHLNWSVHIDSLSDLLPHAQGKIDSEGSIKGIFDATLAAHQQQFNMAAKLKADNIIYQTTHVQHVDIRLNMHSDPQQHSQLQINARSLQLNTQTIKQLTVNLDGPLKQHLLQLNIEHEQANVQLQLQGQLDPQTINWSGQIQQLQLTAQTLGQWQQETPANFMASREKISLSSLCLKEHSRHLKAKHAARLCSQLNWTADKGSARLQLSELSFLHFKPYLPEEITQFSGALNVQADIKLAPLLLARIKADILPGELVFQTLSNAPVTLTHQNGHITADYNATEFNALWHINMGPHSLDGDINIPRKALETQSGRAPINGNIKLAVRDLELISILVPQISDIKGQLAAQLQLNGSLDKPAITGYADFTAAYLDIRDTGTRIENIRLKVVEKDAGQALSLLGQLHSGKGQLDISGLLTLDPKQGWPLTLNIAGRDFLAVNLPEIYAVISPDIQFSQNKRLMTIKGNIFIPEANISPNTIPTGSISVSPDIEIVGLEKAKPANMELNIALDLGPVEKNISTRSSRVQVDAFGLKSKLSGKITLVQQPGQLVTAHGQLHLIDGTFRAYGQDLNIEQGNIFYAGGYLDNPGIKLTASRQLAETKVGIKVTGSANKPRINTFSDDSTLDSKDIISMILTGQKVDNLENTRIYAGTEISDDLSVGVNAGAGDEGSEFITRYKLTDKIQLEGTSSANKSGGSIIYTFEVE